MIKQDHLLQMRLLIVDDEPVNIALLEDLLQISGYTQVQSTNDPRRVGSICQVWQPDAILLDLNMPNLDGFGVMRELQSIVKPEDYLPILVLTADISVETKRRALSVGATDFLTKPFDPVEVLLRIKNLLRTRYQHLQLSDQTGLLEECVRERTAELSQTLDQLRDAQEQMVQQERLSALGSMTAGIAHDFNNVLSLILGYSEMLMRSLHQPQGKKGADTLLVTIISAAQDAAKMFSRLRDFYRPVGPGHAREEIDFNALVEQTVALTRPRWHGQALGQGATILLEMELREGLPLLPADPAELREMLTNLIFNAVDAMPHGGTLRLQTRLEEAAAASGGIAAGERCVVLEVSDTGMGMDEETRRRCLEPFFTTKGSQGTGLGLAMVCSTVQSHGGAIGLHSTPGLGTTFVFSFPVRTLVVEAAHAFDAAQPQVPVRILAVDDQPVLCEILVEYLTDEWHEVETAGDGYEALEKFRHRPFDLIITDKAMPGMGGEQLALQAKAISERTRVIMLTGYGAISESPREASCVDLVLDKPTTCNALREAVGRVMAGANAEAAAVQINGRVFAAGCATDLEHASR